MTARELHDATLDLLEKGVDRLCYGTDERQIVLRALDLLARVEESEDELVRELREARDTYDGYGGTSGHLLHRAAARIVALKAERDALKAHAEAMHNKARRVVNGHAQVAAVEALESALDAYRRDFPKDAP